MLRIIQMTVPVILVSASAAMACPDYESGARAPFIATAAQFSAPRGFSVIAGGNHNVVDCPSITPDTEKSAGFFTDAPDFTFQLSDMSQYSLEVRLSGSCDTALLINTDSATWHYAVGETGGDDPMITLSDQIEGDIDIWVGTTDNLTCSADLELVTVRQQ